MKRPHRRTLGTPAAIALLLSLAAPAAAAGSGELAVPSGHGQQAIAVKIEGGAVRARVCATGACTTEGGSALPVPDDVKPLLAGARATRIELAGGKSVVRIDVAGAADEQGAPASAWVMLVAAPLTGKGSEPRVIWSGWTGLTRGEIGEERSAAVLDQPAKKGKGSRLLVGERRGDVTICGRPALVAAKEVDPATLELTRAASVQNLSEADRAKATRLSAARIAGKPVAPAPSAIRLLRATLASSAVDKKFGTLTDGDADTVWSENKAHDGHGEFVSIGASSDVGITSFELSVRPGVDVPDGAAPKTFFLATPERIFEVSMPEDAWKQAAGTRYTVKLPEALRASCVAVVLGDAYAPAGAKNARVTLAELEAKTPFDGASVEALVGALAGGGDRSKGAAAMLGRAGKPGVLAAIAGYGKLDDAGRHLAAGVIDAAACSDQVPFYADRLSAASAGVAAAQPASPDSAGGSKPETPPRAADRGARGVPAGEDPELAHARDRLRRCGRAAAPALAKIITGDGAAQGAVVSERARLIAADELALVAPAEAVPILLDALAKASDATRRDLRAALARAAKSSRAWPVLKDELEPAKLKARGEQVAIDLLRAIGPHLQRVEGAAPAFASLAVPGASFGSRFLLLGPAAELARGGDARAESFLRDALRKDQDGHVRARAADVAGKVPALAAELLAAIEDPEVRVREAVIKALAESAAGGVKPPSGVAAALGRRLATDDWTFIRSGAAVALGALPADAAVDSALATALADGSPDVRGRVLDALGAHRATAFADVVRARQDDAEEQLEVRARAILALSAMCDKRGIDAWTKLARSAKAPTDERDRRLGGAAVAALGAVRPADLAARLAPLMEKDAPPGVKEMARAALSAKSECR